MDFAEIIEEQLVRKPDYIRENEGLNRLRIRKARYQSHANTLPIPCQSPAIETIDVADG